jgi:prepilin-type N-terminal cleavage/methylation domain-containing protein
MKTRTLKSKRSGFSLFELLTTVAILGVLGSLAITAFAGQRGAFEITRDRRNAQEIAQVCMTANAAGLNFLVAGSVENTIRKAVLGGTPSKGSFKGKLFKAGAMTDEDIVGASRFLEIKNGELAYRYDP